MLPRPSVGSTLIQPVSPWPPDVNGLARRVDSIEEVVSTIELRDVIFYKLLAERIEGTDAEQELDDEPASPAIHVAERHEATRIEVRCKLSFVWDGGRYEVDAAARYELAEPLEIPPAILQEFVKRVGVMAVYPYLRESLHLSSSKLRLEAPVLGLLKAGAIQLTAEPSGLAATE
jgi:hypothetical protein